MQQKVMSQGAENIPPTTSLTQRAPKKTQTILRVAIVGGITTTLRLAFSSQGIIQMTPSEAFVDSCIREADETVDCSSTSAFATGLLTVHTNSRILLESAARLMWPYQ